MPDLPDHVTIGEIERHLDRLAVEVEATGDRNLVPLFEWLEGQLDARRRQSSALARIRARAVRGMPPTEAASLENQ